MVRCKDCGVQIPYEPLHGYCDNCYEDFIELGRILVSDYMERKSRQTGD